MKLLLRSRLLRQIEPLACVDLYAGRGRLLAALGPRFREIHAVEQDPAKAAEIARALPGRVQVHVMDNLDFIRQILPRLRDVTYLDFDAYGRPNRAIKEVFEHWRPERSAAIAVTDGSRIAVTRGQRIRLGDYRAGPPAAREDRSARWRITQAEDYELLVRTFWNDLARAHNFIIHDFIGVWKKGKMVYYYGLSIEPHRDQAHPARPNLAQSLEPQPHGAPKA